MNEKEEVPLLKPEMNKISNTRTNRKRQKTKIQKKWTLEEQYKFNRGKSIISKIKLLKEIKINRDGNLEKHKGIQDHTYVFEIN